ncbi:uncharacterized protein AFUA_6G08060 [Aspergillus fumigatus Af293]|uniref:Uncharacterized protein n=2 Tax=Aspergillus fumigatus TaxID=746128 RepID=Q4WN05_ASPFU|nr:hypothetical protein AFUA_6G08060 [Aspergillus fumigatus Af293]EAL88659.1 hypothetical protein AFUA_6G08060 [Aspergillus fumigatus Af293]EDP49378.1 hypothetical protein AFUB_074050 [Aspergillus fumigatus A1163]
MLLTSYCYCREKKLVGQRMHDSLLIDAARLDWAVMSCAASATLFHLQNTVTSPSTTSSVFPLLSQQPRPIILSAWQ